MKKGQSMSLNTIIIAALVVLVLIVLSVIFIRNTGSFSNKTESCILNGGKCVDDGLNCGSNENIDDPNFEYIVRSDLKCGEYEECCVKVK